MSSLSFITKKLFLPCVAISLLSACGEDLKINDESGQEQAIVEGTPFAYVSRDVTSQEQALALNSQHPSAFVPGAQLFVRNAITSETPATDILAEVFGETPYDAKDLNVSMDGRFLIFSAKADTLQDSWNVYEYDFDSGFLRRVISDLNQANAGNDTNPAYTNDGLIVFSTDRHDATQQTTALYSMSREGESLQIITQGIAQDLKATPLKDGYMAFLRLERNTPCDVSDASCLVAGEPQDSAVVYRVAANGENEQKLVDTIYVNDETHVVSQLQFDNVIQGNDGYLLSIVKNKHTPLMGGQIVKLVGPQAQSLQDQSTPIYDFVSAQEVSGHAVQVEADKVIRSGWNSAFWPYRDGTNRMLVSWSQCMKEEGGVFRSCDPLDSLEGVEARYGVWIYDAANNTRMPVLQAKKGRVYTDLALSAPNNGHFLEFDETAQEPVNPISPPADPTNPVTPPTEPSDHTNPTNPVTPPTEPSDPTDPTNPVVPPTEPSDPTDPTNPVTPPTEPSDPTNPVVPPTEPSDPTNPTDPANPVLPPTEPSDPTNPVVPPTEPSDPTDPTNPVTPPTEPSDPTDPTNPVTPPTEPSDPTNPVTPPTEPSDPTDPSDPVTPPTEPSDPADPVTPPTDPADPTDPVVPPTEPSEPPLGDGTCHGMGYWKNHSRYAANPAQQQPWPVDEDTQMCATTWYQMIQDVSQGDTWVILAKHWVASKLNVANGAPVPSEISGALLVADNLLAQCSISEANRDLALTIKDELETYNESEECSLEPNPVDPVEPEETTAVHIRSVYDLDGMDMSELGIENMSNPTVLPMSQRSERFLRVYTQNVDAQMVMNGYAPIEPDGSVMFEVPANTPYLYEVVNVQAKALNNNAGQMNGSGFTYTYMQRPTDWRLAQEFELQEFNGLLTEDNESMPVNTGAIQAGPFPNASSAVQAQHAGQTMAQALFMQVDGYGQLTTSMVYQDYWTPSPLPGNQAINLGYEGLETALPMNVDCLENPSSDCVVYVSYDAHIKPIWNNVARNEAGNTCVDCHDDRGFTSVDLSDFDVNNPSYDELFDHNRTYMYLASTFSEVNESHCRRQVEPPFIIEPENDCFSCYGQSLMNPLGSISSANFFDVFAADVDHEHWVFRPVAVDESKQAIWALHQTMLSAQERKLIAEWLDMGAPR